MTLKTNKIFPRDGQVSGANGGIIQVVSVTKTDTWTASVAEGSLHSSVVTGLTPSITPQSASNKILITGYVTISNDIGGSWGAGIALCNGSTVIDASTGAAVGSRTRLSGVTESTYRGVNIPINFLHSAATTSTVTYGIKVWNGHTSSSNVSINYTNDDDTDDNNHFRAASTITLMEICG